MITKNRNKIYMKINDVNDFVKMKVCEMRKKNLNDSIVEIVKRSIMIAKLDSSKNTPLSDQYKHSVY